MPHRVANFLRSSSGSIPHIKKKAKSASSSRNASAAASRNGSISASPYASDSDDQNLQQLQHQQQHQHHHAHTGKMQEHLADALRKHHRLSLPFGRSSSKERQERGHQHGGTARDGGLSLDWAVESPPLVYYGSPAESSGALFSGQMFVDVRDEAVELDSFVASLSLRVTHKRPYQSHCPDCQSQVTELKSWTLLAQPATLRKGRHQFPFSMLLGGHLPASMDSPVLSIAYEFRAEAMVVVPGGSSCRNVRLERPVAVKRSLPEPLYPHHSVRIFPPTNIKASARYNAVIHPTGSNTLTLKLDGLVTHNEKVRTLDLWKLKKVTWRLEETIKTIAPACPKHAANAIMTTTEEDVPERKGTYRSETRVIGEKVMQEGWKSDFSGNDGTVDMEFDYSALNPPARSSGGAAAASAPKFACDTKWEDGTEVTHSLLLELIVSKEYAPEGKPQLATQTGTGRILRMHFAVGLTEFPGLGVSWDNEAPPVYQDVPPSPPAYPSDEDEREPPIDYCQLEPLHLELLEAERATPPRRLSDAEQAPVQLPE